MWWPKPWTQHRFKSHPAGRDYCTATRKVSPAVNVRGLSLPAEYVYCGKARDEHPAVPPEAGPMKLPTLDCPHCSRRTEDMGDHFGCPHHGRLMVTPEEWYLDQAARFGRSAVQMMPLANYAYREARWAARAAMRACPSLREDAS
jgi:hypothetical protein